ncbi:PadR family transcriptional regulator [Tissierella sp.]|uniref:PadR family transcriptional regulator n=1 Tax=Tissierella sp. TaxID=41274 RepID=UPI00285FD1A3|nr:PadR family transcriptional regulator [Tissierella sp.]MDR7855096.1 PadR family transcriptional regulator [Tissierella sp.]
MAREQLQNLTESMYYILLALTTERHGYEIMQEIEEFTNGRVTVGPGTLYALLGRFEKEGFINLVSEENRKKTYIITQEGRSLLEEEINRLKQLIQDGEGIIKDINKNEKHMKEDKKIRASIFKRSNDDILY